MTFKLLPPGARKGNRHWLVRGAIAGRRYEVSTGAIEEDRAREFANEFEAALTEDMRRQSREAVLASMGRPGASGTAGFVYFVGADNGLVKIGYSVDPISRIAAMQTGSGPALQLIGALPGTYEDERNLQLRFSEYLIRGEWFARRGALAEFIAGMFGDV